METELGLPTFAHGVEKTKLNSDQEKPQSATPHYLLLKSEALHLMGRSLEPHSCVFLTIDQSKVSVEYKLLLLSHVKQNVRKPSSFAKVRGVEKALLRTGG